MDILYTARFLRSFKKLESGVQEDVAQAIDRFKNTKNHAQLRVHKLSGKMKGYSSFSANFLYRIVIKIEKSVVYIINVGTHSMYE